MQRVLMAVPFALGAVACAREPLPARAPSYVPASAYAWSAADPHLAIPPPPALLAGVGASAETPSDVLPPAPEGPVTRARPDVPRIDSHSIPSGERCLGELAEAGVVFSRIEEKRGVDTPVLVSGDIGGIRYEAGAGHSMVCDCRLALALARVAPVMKQAGMTAARFSGAYSYRMSRVGRLSLHAYGLAIDIHELVINGRRLSVTSDFVRGIDWCGADAPPLNHLACELKATGLFRELLTPDYNADHRDHFHLAIAPEGRPMPTAPPHPAGHGARKTPATPLPPLPEPVEIDQEPTIEPDPADAPKPEKEQSHPTKERAPHKRSNERSSDPRHAAHAKTAAREPSHARRRRTHAHASKR